MFDINKLPNANSIAPATPAPVGPAPAPIPTVTTAETVGPAVAPARVITPVVPTPSPIIEEVKAPMIEDVPPMSDEDLLNMGAEIKENNINSDVFVETLLNSKGENGFTKLPETIKEAQELAKFLS